jgi:hypothetical protein
MKHLPITTVVICMALFCASIITTDTTITSKKSVIEKVINDSIGWKDTR